MSIDADDERHGTANGYLNLDCRCERCRAAATTYSMKGRRARFAALRDGSREPLRHNRSTYSNWGCRCETCKADWALAAREQTARRRCG